MNAPGMRPSWPAQPPVLTSIATARMGTRLIAFLIDAVILVGLSLTAYSIASVFGVWSIDSEWLAQYTSRPDVMPSMPAIHIDLNLLFGVSVGIAVSIVLYAALCWRRWGALPGQRMLGLRVLDYDTGKPMGLGAALARSMAIFGVLGAVLAAYATLSFERLATIALNDPTPELLPPGTPLAPWLDVIGGLFFLGSIWLLMVIVSTTSNRQRRGVHDRMGRSIVVEIRRQVVWSQAHPVYPGYPPYPPYPPPPVAPQPGWTPPGTWTPPGQQGSIDWHGSSTGVPAPDAPAPDPAAAPPTPDATPWKADERDPKRAGERPSEREMASVARRLTAYAFDSTILMMLFVAALQTLSPDGSLDNATLSNERTAILGGLAGGVIQLVYFVLGWTLWKGTPGQRIVGIAVVLETDGKAMSPMDAVVRWAVVQGPMALVSIVPLAISPVVFVFAAGWMAYLLYSTRADANCQGLHDHFLGTKVVVS